MDARYKVLYSFKSLDKSSYNYGVLQDGERKFDTFCEAVAYVRQIRSINQSGVAIVGTPILERA